MYYNTVMFVSAKDTSLKDIAVDIVNCKTPKER